MKLHLKQLLNFVRIYLAGKEISENDICPKEEDEFSNLYS